MIAMVHQNSPTVEFWQEKIDGPLRRADTEPSADFKRANTELSVYFRKANTEPIHKNKHRSYGSKLVGKRSPECPEHRTGFPRSGRAAPRDCNQALPSGNPLEQPCQPLKNPIHPFSFTWINPIPKNPA